MPFIVWTWGAIFIGDLFSDPVQNPQPGPSNSGIVLLLGAGMDLVLAVFLQATVGLFTLWLFRKVAKLWQFTMLGTMIGSGLALLLWWMAMSVNMPPAPLPALLMCQAIFVPPFAAGYALAFYFECHRPVVI